MAITIRSGPYAATIVAEGAGLASLQYRGHDLVLSHSPDERPRGYSGKVLIPWPNRIKDGTFDWRGTTLRLPINEPERNAALHGLAGNVPWKVDELRDAEVTLSTEITPSPGYPFHLHATVAYSLDDMSGLTITLTTTNMGDEDAPYGASIHPYLTCGAKVDDFTLRVPAKSVATMDATLTPTGYVPVEEAGLDLREEVSLRSRSLDHCFTDLPQEEWTVRVANPETGRAVELSSVDPWVQVYSGEELDRLGVAVEPMTCPPNAFNSGIDLKVLAPGEASVFTAQIKDASTEKSKTFDKATAKTATTKTSTVNGSVVTAPPVRGPSMADVADLAGVSHQTVSRVLNNKGSVKDATREKVIEAIEQLGYRRNEAARALASSRSRLIGVITPRFVEWGPASTLLSVQLAANRAGYFVSVATLPDFEEATVRGALDDLLSLGVAGLVVIAPLTSMAHELERQTIPVPTLVIASRWVTDQSNLVRIGMDQRVGVKAAIKHLADQGCRSVGHISGPADNFDALEREQAWRTSTEEFGMETGPQVEGDWSAKQGYQAGKKLLESTLPDAVFVANDQMSLGFLKALSEASVQVPTDLRVVGYDDEDGVAFFDPSLTTVRQNFDAIGQEAIRAITTLISGQYPSPTAIPTELIVRASA